MNRNEFNRFVAGIDLPGPVDLEGLRELTALFPWFHSAHLVLLKGLRTNSDIRFDSQLKASALSVSDREVLYHYLFLSPDEGAVDPNLAGEEVTAPEAELTIVMEEAVAAPVVAGETAPEEEMAAPVEEVTAREAESAATMEEERTPVAGETTPEEEMAAPVEEVSAREAESAATMEEERAPVAGETTPEEEDATPAEEGILPPGMADETSAPEEAKEMLLPKESEVRDEGQAEELPGSKLSETKVDADTEIRTREELIAEIEARLKELESYRQVIGEEPKTGIGDEMVATPEQELEPEPELIQTGEPEPEHVQAAKHESEPEIKEPSAPETRPEPEIEEPPAPEPRPEPDIEEPPAAGSAELLELIPDTVAEVETPEGKLSPADLIDRFIMISPTMERMSPKEYQPVRDLTEQGSDEPGKFITETLANIYVTQGYYTRAINIYEKLALQYPEKSVYFASRIEKIKDLIK